MTKAIGPLKGVDLINAVDYRISCLREKIAEASKSREQSDRLIALAHELKEAYQVRSELRWDGEFLAIPAIQDCLDAAGGLSGAVAAHDHQQPESDDEAEIIAVARRLVGRYICNADTNSEFIACVTPNSSTIGTGGVWDDWRLLRRLVNGIPKRG